MAYLMGIDLGTSSIKVIVIDENGKKVAMCAQDYELLSPRGGYAEQAPSMWWDACCDCVRGCLEGQGVSADDISAVSFSGQMHGAVLLDADEEVIRPAILHCDARSGEQVEKMKALLGRERVERILMNPVYTGFLAPSLLWVKECEPENFERVRHAFLPKDYLRYRLTGEIGSDYSDASATLAFDVGEQRWSDEALELLGFPRDIFPNCGDAVQQAAVVSAEAARQTGLKAGTPVAYGGGDQIMQSLGNGVTGGGWATVNIGTSGQVFFPGDAPGRNSSLSTNTFCSYKRDKWFTMGAIMNAGLSLRWFRSIISSRSYAEMDREIADMRPGSGGLLFLPYLNGERTPHLNPNLSGMMAGLNLSTSWASMACAVMEGVAYALMQCLELCTELGQRAERMVASGGGARSSKWLQIQADVFNLPLYLADNVEQAAVGAAIAAGVGAGVFKDVREGCAAVVRYGETPVLPDEDRHREYMDYYALFKDAYAANRELLERLTALSRV